MKRSLCLIKKWIETITFFYLTLFFDRIMLTFAGAQEKYTGFFLLWNILKHKIVFCHIFQRKQLNLKFKLNFVYCESQNCYYTLNVGTIRESILTRWQVYAFIFLRLSNKNIILFTLTVYVLWFIPFHFNSFRLSIILCCLLNCTHVIRRIRDVPHLKF